MANFKYRGRTSDGRVAAGIVEADSREAAMQALTERSIEVLLLEEQKGAQAAGVGGIMALFNKPSAKDLVVASRTLSVMVSAAIPIPDSLRNISVLTKNIVLKAALIDMASEVEGGTRLSDALERYPKIFNGFFVNMVRSGETTGQLGDVLEYLADQTEKDYDLQSKLRGAMIYPAFVVSAMVIVGIVMMTFVIPNLTSVLIQSHVQLPWTTQLLIGTSNFMINYWYILVIVIFGSVFGFRWWVRTPLGRLRWDRIKLSLPVFGSFFQKVYVVRFSRSLATLLKGGMDVVGALEIVAGVVGNEAWRQVIYETIKEVNDGNPMATAFQRHSYIPAMMVQMLSVGEGTGKTAEILTRVSNFYSREVDETASNMTKVIEPLVLLVLGGGVGVLVSAILLPMYSLAGAS